MTPTPVPFSITNPGSTTLLYIAAFFILARLVSRVLAFLVRKIIKPNTYRHRGRRTSPERALKLQVLIGSLITFLAFLVAVMASLSLFISTSTLIWILGLFSAAFGLSAKPLVSDLLAGMDAGVSDQP